VVGLGASYGGFTSNWLNGYAPKGMFKAFVCHCGTFDLRSSYFSTEELFFMEHEFGGTPYEPAAKEGTSPYVRCNPAAKVDQWETPTLVIHGAKDFRLVESEGISTFTALQHCGVPSEMLYLPAENHHCLNPQNSIVWHETVLRWIKTWTE
jgi:dipeptidyl aminopeptidase/acylaminoacyl peptidase